MVDIKGFEYSTLVLSGGGIKGFQHLGGLHYLLKYVPMQHFKRLVGSSIGAVVLLFCSLGYTPVELFHFFVHLDIGQLKLGIDLVKLIQDFGMNSQEPFLRLLEGLLEKKGLDPQMTLADHYAITGIDFIVSTTNMTTFKPEMLSHASHSDLPVIKAIAMTTCLPLFFQPVLHNDCFYLDGGLSNNYPIELFPDAFGMLIVDIDTSKPEMPENLVGFLYRLFNYSVFQNVYQKYPQYREHTVLFFNQNKLTPVSLWMGEEQKRQLFCKGYRLVRAFFEQKAAQRSDLQPE